QKSVPATVVFYERNPATRRLEEKHIPLLALYERASAIWLGAVLRDPDARQSKILQEETYEMELKHIRYFQREHMDGLLKPLSHGLFQWAPPPPLPFAAMVTIPGRERLWDDLKNKIRTFRDFRGFFDMVWTVQGLDETDEQQLKAFLLGWSTRTSTIR